MAKLERVGTYMVHDLYKSLRSKINCSLLPWGCSRFARSQRETMENICSLKYQIPAAEDRDESRDNPVMNQPVQHDQYLIKR